MQDIELFNRFIKVESVNKGWSGDKKYCVTRADRMRYLLRISPAEQYEKRKVLFELLERVAGLGIPMCMPIEFGACGDGVYILESWIDGEGAEAAIPMLSETKQYGLGLKSGEILRKIHIIPAPDEQEDWVVRFNRKTNYKIRKYRECGKPTFLSYYIS
ncbi:phosphotransferase family protein [Desulfosporosinus youngiae]|uniref:Putative aminoglycoside phosphotransferase n=1 Tax=Desulfosporosinus youngiae DSM 17734 TaxID=768710 RepID=H5Y687_9FIRM|nr:phosphotransferase [Desulfosporosinus youngiae]EHQ91097.1 putative aminoglycoside phosphotransferase [Desulfosporosinus youngiae DSM 17734]